MTTTDTRPSAAKATRHPKPPKLPKPMTFTQRSKLAEKGIVTSIGATEEKVAVAAALEAVYERLASDPTLRQTIGEKYAELAALAKPVPKPDRGSAPTPRPARAPARYNPLAKTNPYELADEWGRDQLRALLEGASQGLLREAVDVVYARNQGTKLPNRSRNKDMVDYIMEYVAGPGY